MSELHIPDDALKAACDNFAKRERNRGSLDALANLNDEAAELRNGAS